MTASAPTHSRAATLFGLFIALFAMPLVLLGFQLAGPVNSTEAWATREASVFALLGVLIVVIKGWERLPLSSISPGTKSALSSFSYALLGLLACAVGLAFCIWLVQALGWTLGGGADSGFEPPIWALLLTLLRAGVVEEVFYRGYGIERLTAVTGSRALAVTMTLVLFAVFHYRQGPAGIFVAFVIGAILTGMYLLRRDTVANIITHFLGDFIPNIVLASLFTR